MDTLAVVTPVSAATSFKVTFFGIKNASVPGFWITIKFNHIIKHFSSVNKYKFKQTKLFKGLKSIERA